MPYATMIKICEIIKATYIPVNFILVANAKIQTKGILTKYVNTMFAIVA